MTIPSEKFAGISTQNNEPKKDEESKSTMKSAEPFAYSRLMNPEWRLELVERIDQLIEQIKNSGIEELIFLDKSARPLSWLFQERWNNKQSDPKIKYIDMGTMEVRGKKTIIEEMSEEGEAMYKSLDEIEKKSYTEDDEWFWKKNNFAEGTAIDDDIWLSKKNIPKIWLAIVAKHPDLIEKIRSRYGKKLQKKVLIIDELLMTGETLRATAAVFAQAYPQSEIFGVHFFNQRYKKPALQIPWFKQPHMIGVTEDEGKLTTKKFSGGESDKKNLSSELRAIIKEIAHIDITELKQEIADKKRRNI
ncbi:hypothetical protein KKC32_05150 [Patescibacteria group bacterium]|nr:hypothetical protein [Patescibacteria group bacterium]